MAFDIEGKLYKKFDTNQVTDSFKKREFVLEIEDGAYTQLIKFQLTQNNCDKLDPYNENEQIKVTFSLRGREYTKDGRTSYFTNLDAWRLEKAGAAQSAEVPNASFDSFPTMTDAPSSEGGSNMDDDLPF
ncbi:MAG: DUF3127 domain-containing protein [Bacteroidota bacterium]